MKLVYGAGARARAGAGDGMTTDGYVIRLDSLLDLLQTNTDLLLLCSNKLTTHVVYLLTQISNTHTHSQNGKGHLWQRNCDTTNRQTDGRTDTQSSKLKRPFDFRIVSFANVQM